MKYRILSIAPLFALSLVACSGTDETPATTAEANSALSASGSPAAGPRRGRGDGKGGGMFARSDANRDGKLVPSEVPAEMWSHISVADVNADGAVTQEELRAAHDQGKIQRPLGRGMGDGKGAGMFARSDANQDGKLVASEVPAEMWSHISVADANADGAVTQEELRAAHDQGKIQRPEGRGNGERMFARFDANQDGKLVASEVPAEAWSRISVADANADGAVTQEELRAAHDQGKIQRRAGRGKGPRS